MNSLICRLQCFTCIDAGISDLVSRIQFLMESTVDRVGLAAMMK